jgi:hypothetical protein
MRFAKEEYGAENAQVFNAHDIWDPAVAEVLCKYKINQVRRRRVIVEFETYINGADIEPGHVIQFDDEIGDRVTFPGEGTSTWSAHRFNVTQVSLAKSAGQLARVYVRAKEVYSNPVVGPP